MFEDPLETARRLAPELKREAELVVCLSHCGFQVDEELARVPEVDLVLGGHSHKVFVQQDAGAKRWWQRGGTGVTCRDGDCGAGRGEERGDGASGRQGRRQKAKGKMTTPRSGFADGYWRCCFAGSAGWVLRLITDGGFAARLRMTP